MSREYATYTTPSAGLLPEAWRVTITMTIDEALDWTMLMRDAADREQEEGSYVSAKAYRLILRSLYTDAGSLSAYLRDATGVESWMPPSQP